MISRRGLLGCGALALASPVLIVCKADIRPPSAPVISVAAASSSAITVSLVTASVDVGSSGIGSYSVERATSANGTYAVVSAATSFPCLDTGLSSATTYYYRARASDNAGNAGTYSAVVSTATHAPVSLLSWPYQVTSYRSALPGLAGHGMDFGTDLPSKLYFITSLADTAVGGADASFGPNCFSGTFRYCWQADQGVGFHKYIIPLVGGYAFIGRRVTGPAGRGNLDYIGQAAPGAGFFVRCCGLRLGGGTNQRVWHLASWLGDEASASGVTNFTADFRDCLGSSQDTFASGSTAWINCEARFGMDEEAELGFYAMNGISWIRGACYDPLHVPPDFALPPPSHHLVGVDHGYGMLIGGSDFCDNSLVTQSLFAHTTDRNPLVSTNNHAHINNLHYNHGRPNPGGRGAGCKISDNGGFNTAAGIAMKCNVVGNVTVMGPEQIPTQAQQPVLAEAIGAFPAGSTAHCEFNAQFGWVSVASQSDFMRTVPTANYLQPTLRTTAWPAGYGLDYSGVLRPFTDPLAPVATVGLAFSDLVRRTVGCKPAKRFMYTGGLNTVMNQIDDRISGTADSFQYANTVTEAGGWPALPTTTVDPLNPGTEYHAPMPLAANRDDVLTSGTFADGSSKVGYTRLRAWTIDQYFYVLDT